MNKKFITKNLDMVVKTPGKGIKRFFSLLLACVIYTGLFSFPVSAAAIKDVKSTDATYPMVSRIVDKGYMTLDSSGNFNPANLVDKFETSKILAKAAGYKTENMTPAEKTYIDNAYNKNKSFLALYAKAFTKWTTSADKEIAYLLEMGIFTTDDLNQFVIKDTAGVEKVRALTREEIGVFLVKMMGKVAEDEALSKVYKYDFNDDAKISTSKKQYIYYLKEKTIVQGGDNAAYDPQGTVNRAAFAIYLDRTVNYMNTGNINGVKATSDTSAGTGTSSGTDSSTGTGTSTGITQTTSLLTNITGTVDMLLPSAKAVQVLRNDGVKKIYQIIDETTIYINNVRKSFSDLYVGLSVTIVVKNDKEIIDIQAKGTLSTGTENSGTGTTNTNTNTTNTNTNTTNTTDNSTTTTNNTQNTTTVPEPVELSALDCIVASTAANTQTSTNTISVTVRMLNPKGDIISETRTYTLTADCVITRGEAKVTFADIKKSDIARIEYSGTKVYTISLEEKDRKFNDVTLVDKRYSDLTKTPILTIEDKKGNTIDLRLTTSSSLYRANVKKMWNEIRIGDSLDIVAEYDSIVTLYAYGTKSTIDAWVAELHITADKSVIALRESDNSVNEYRVIMDNVDPYAYKIGTKVRVRLDSKEIESISKLEESATSLTLTGYVSALGSGSISVRDGYTVKEIRYDSTTVFVDARTGLTAKISDVKIGLNVSVYYVSSTSNLAKSITILAE